MERLTKEDIKKLLSSGITLAGRMGGKQMATRVLGEMYAYKCIEEELGIDLITLFEALKNGFYAYKDNHIIKLKSEEGNCGAMCFYVSYDCIIAENVFDEQYIYLLKDYGKTWALTKEELI